MELKNQINYNNYILVSWLLITKRTEWSNIKHYADNGNTSKEKRDGYSLGVSSEGRSHNRTEDTDMIESDVSLTFNHEVWNLFRA